MRFVGNRQEPEEALYESEYLGQLPEHIVRDLDLVLEPTDINLNMMYRFLTRPGSRVTK
jgi:hypothetical protein